MVLGHAPFFLYFCFFFFFFFNDTATTEIYTLSLHDALPTCCAARSCSSCANHSTPSARPTDWAVCLRWRRGPRNAKPPSKLGWLTTPPVGQPRPDWCAAWPRQSN